MQLINSLALALALASTPLLAQVNPMPGFPSKPIRLICPYPPGGGASDVVSRSIAHEMSKTLGTPVVVENRPGAGSTVGSEIGARSAPDGYTLTTTSSPLFAVVPLLYKKLSYDPRKAFASIIVLASFTNVLAVHPSVDARTVKDLIAFAKANPGKLVYASTGSGSTTHLAAELFKSMTGTDMVHVPYKGSPPALTDMLAGRIHVMFNNTPNMVKLIEAGQVRALGVTSPTREKALPNVPTIAEAGVPGYKATGWFSLSAPAGTPKPVIEKLHAAAALGVKSPEFINRLEALGFGIVGGTPVQMDKMIDEEVAQWGPVVKASGATAD